MGKVTIGADPELFVFTDITKGYISGHDLFPGTKHEPHAVGLGAVQVDGVAFEFNIRPANDKREFVRAVTSMLLIGDRMLKQKNQNFKLVATPTAVFTPQYFETLPEEAKLLGCDPDFNAYTGNPNNPPETKEPFRTGSGHVHVGWGEDLSLDDPGHIHDCIGVTQQLDGALFLPSLLWDNDNKRRQLYGNVGAYRPKLYGVEYRVLSNAWLTDRRLMETVYDYTSHAMELAEDSQWLLKDKRVKRKIDHARKGGEFRREDINEYVDILVKDYSFPEFPEEYRV